MYAWQFAKMQYVAELNGWTKFASIQDQYNLVQRGEEQEMFFWPTRGSAAVRGAPLPQASSHGRGA